MTTESGSRPGEEELLAFARILSWAFGMEVPDNRLWLDHLGLTNVRLARIGQRVVGGLGEVPMGQWFGGRSVPTLGLAGVAVGPDARGERVALSLVLESLRAARSRGIALSALYPATVTLYRAAGYELAGARYAYKAALGSLPASRTALRVSELGPDDSAEIEALYRRVAAQRPGYLDRGPYVWRRVRQGRKDELHPAFGVRGDSGLEGYVYLSIRGSGYERELVAHDFVASTSAAASRLLALFADHRSTIKSVLFHAAFPEPSLMALPELAFRPELSEHWMLRVVDVEAALATRGYPAVETQVDLELTDRSLPENSGRYRLEVSGGRASVTRGGSGAVALDERALAALYSGFLPPHALARSARFAGDDASLARLALLFAGAAPAMSDFF